MVVMCAGIASGQGKLDDGIKAFYDQSYEKAAELLRSFAHKGNPEALYYLGQSYLYLQSPQKAHGALEKSAAQGYLPAVFELGKNLYEGKILEQNKDKGFKYIEQAAQQGFAEAQVYYFSIVPPSKQTVSLLSQASRTNVQALDLLTQLYTNESELVNWDYNSTFELKHRLLEMDPTNSHYAFLLAEHTFHDRKLAATISTTPEIAKQISDMFVLGQKFETSYMRAITWCEIACTKSPIPRYDYISRFIELANALDYDQDNLPPDLIEVLSYVFYKGTKDIYINLKRAKRWTQLAINANRAPHHKEWLEDINEKLEQNPDILPYPRTVPEIPEEELASPTPQAFSDYYHKLEGDHAYETYLFTVKTLQQSPKPEDLKKYVDRLLESQDQLQIPDLMLPVDIIKMLAGPGQHTAGLGNCPGMDLTCGTKVNNTGRKQKIQTTHEATECHHARRP